MAEGGGERIKGGEKKEGEVRGNRKKGKGREGGERWCQNGV